MRIRSRRVTLAILGVLLCGLPARESHATPESLRARLASQEAANPQIALGVLFEPLHGEGGSVSLHEGRLLPPASVQKIVTTIAALDILGPDHTFQTELVAEQPIRHGRV